MDGEYYTGLSTTLFFSSWAPVEQPINHPKHFQGISPGNSPALTVKSKVKTAIAFFTCQNMHITGTAKVVQTVPHVLGMNSSCWNCNAIKIQEVPTFASSPCSPLFSGYLIGSK